MAFECVPVRECGVACDEVGFELDRLSVGDGFEDCGRDRRG